MCAVGVIISCAQPAAHAQAPAGPSKLRPGVALKTAPTRLSQPLFADARAQGGAIVARVNLQALAEIKSAAGPLLIEDVPLGVDRKISLEVERFRVTRPGAQFVIGRGQHDAPGAFDSESVVLLRGRVAGDLYSRVYLALSPHGSNGFIESGSMRCGLSSRLTKNAALAPWELAIFPALVSGPNPSPFCHLHDLAPAAPPDGSPSVVPHLRQIELAIETDHEFYLVFNDADAAFAYVLQLYGAVSDIFMRNINARIDLTFVRIWDTPTVPFSSGLGAFRDYWNANMQWVPRDVAQMFSGRGDLPGGIAFLSALCGQNAYSFCGNVVGHFAGVDDSSVYNYDLLVAAHELGHNFGTLHTDSYGLDICNQPSTPPQRGTLMSYCSQTVSGGNAVMDMAFHTVTQNAMKEHTYAAACVVFDCNQNGVSDEFDIGLGASADTNANGVPDECEDCNTNGVLDTVDILAGASSDVNQNGLPDECEPDCNANGVPDDVDIQLGVSADVHGNGVPDECETDCDNNGVADYNQIMADMTLDKNRNVILDSCEDCDNDGVTDLVELDGAWNIWAASNSQSAIRQYHAVTGVHMKTSAGGQVSGGWDLIIAPGRRVLVTSTSSNKVVEFDDEGNYVRDLVAAGAGSLSSPTGMAISPAGTLLVSSRANHRVIEFNLNTGAFIRNFVAPGSGGLTLPLALAFGPDQHLYVSSASNQIFKYHGQSGAFISIFVPSSANGGLTSPRGLLFKPDDNLLVTSFGTDAVLEYNGASGAYIKQWSVIGVAFQGPWCIRLAPSGHVHVSANQVTDSHVTKADIHEFNLATGNWIRGYVQGADAGLVSASGFDYLPGDATDCNMNQAPDNCDIASGVSADKNANGIPDECEPPLCPADIAPLPGGDNQVNVQDLLLVINNWGSGPGNPADVNNDGIVNVGDLLAVINSWGACE